MRTPALGSRLAAEALGTFWLVFGGCGSAVFAAKFLAPNVVAGQSVQLGIGFLGVALAFGLTVVTMAYAVGHVSGAHFNPAVTLGIAVGRRFPWRDVPAYVVAQVVGGLVAGLALWGIARGVPGFDVTEPNACQFFLCGEIEGNPTQDYRSTVWPRLRRRYGMGGPAMTSGPFGHGQ